MLVCGVMGGEVKGRKCGGSDADMGGIGAFILPKPSETEDAGVPRSGK